MSKNRIEQLDSIKGLASIVVLMNHILLLVPSLAEGNTGINAFYDLLLKTPLRIIWGGNEAVLLFFILSGFGLSLSYINGNNKSYSQHLMKRMYKLYIPFIVAVSLAALMNFIFYSNTTLIGVSDWGNGQWENLSISTLLNHFFFIGDYNTNALNGPIWTLIHEMRVSIIFPLIMMIFIRLSVIKNVIFAMVLAVLGYGLNIMVDGSKVSFIITIYYASFFIMGALLAQHRQKVIAFLDERSVGSSILIFLAGVLLITYSYWFFPNQGILHIGIVDQWISAIGSLIVISCSLSFAKMKSFLKAPFLLKLGELSFSIYLYHFIVILSLVHAFNGILPLWLICILSIIGSLVVASVMHKVVGKVTLLLGHRLPKRKDLGEFKL